MIRRFVFKMLIKMLQVKTYLSEADYLSFERQAEEKHEYYKGKIFAMSGASFQHNLIEDNIRMSMGNF